MHLKNIKIAYRTLIIKYYLSEYRLLINDVLSEVILFHLTFTLLPLIIAFFLKDIRVNESWLNYSDLGIVNIVLSGYTIIQFIRLKIDYQGDRSDRLYNGMILYVLMLILSSCLYIYILNGDSDKVIQNYSRILFVFNVIFLTFCIFFKQKVIYEYDVINKNFECKKYSNYLQKRIWRIDFELSNLENLISLRAEIDLKIIETETLEFQKVDDMFNKELETISARVYQLNKMLSENRENDEDKLI